MSFPFEVTILGSSAAVPTLERNQTALIVRFHNELLLFDAGEGVQKRLMECHLKPSKITRIFISHLHSDHFIGLIGLVNSFALQGRKNKLSIYATKELEHIIDIQLKAGNAFLSYPIEFHALEKTEFHTICESKMYSVSAFPVDHRIPCFGFLLKEKQENPTIVSNKIKDKNFPIEAFKSWKKREDFTDENGQLHAWGDYTEEAQNLRSFAFVTDTRPLPALERFLSKCNLMYHESTFLHEKKELAIKTNHSTSIEAAEMAKLYAVNKLILGHFSSRYHDTDVLLHEARTIFAATFLGTEGVTFQVN